MSQINTAPRTLHLYAPSSADRSLEANVSTFDNVSISYHADISEIVQGALSDKNGVLVLDANSGDDLTETLTRVGSLVPTAMGLVLGNNMPVSAVKRLLGLPRWDILDTPVTDTALLDAFQRIAVEDEVEESGQSGKCWTFTSAVGGAGATTIAVEAAYQIAQQKSANKVCLVDLNLFDGAIASYLDVPSNLKLESLPKDPARIDLGLIEAFLTHHKSGIHVLSAPRNDSFDLNVNPAAILHVLDLVCQHYDHVIVDLPRWPTSWSPGVLSGSDETLVVSELTVPALHATRARCEDIEQQTNGLAETKIILNRMSKRMFGNSVSVSQAEDAIGRSVFGGVQSDWDAAYAAVNIGQPIGANKSGSKIAKDISAIIRDLVGEPNELLPFSRKKAAA